LQSFLQRHRRIALDTSIFIYELEATARYVPITAPIFAWIGEMRHSAVTSTITLAELLVQPYRNANQDRVNQFYGLLTTYPNLEWIAPDLEIADLAARFRAEHRLRIPDALHAATAAGRQATGFVTNDSIFRKVDAFETLVLEELL
jgi:predicted nucleic acid-binding protein